MEFFDVAEAPPKHGRPPRVLSYQEFLAVVKKAAPIAHPLRRRARHQVADQRRTGDDQRERRIEEEDADERRARERDQQPVFSARLLMRSSASTTITSTAALMPNSAPSIHAIPRPSA